jgi:hypothetical protein
LAVPKSGTKAICQNRFGRYRLLLTEEVTMSKQTPKDDPRERTDWGSDAQTDKPWKGNPEKEQRSGTKKSDPDLWQETNTH